MTDERAPAGEEPVPQPTPEEERDAVLAERLDWEAEQERRAALADDRAWMSGYAAGRRAAASPDRLDGLREWIEALPVLRLTGEQLSEVSDADRDDYHSNAERFAVDWDEWDEFVRLDDLRAALTTAGTPGIDGPSEAFVAAASADMLARMRDGERRGWGDSWKHDYPDAAVCDRVMRARLDLFHALSNFRRGLVGADEVRKRAADVANQAFMLADPTRLAESES